MNGRTGIGIFSNRYSECIRLSDETSIYTAESFAIFLAMKYGLRMGRDFTIFSDSYSCLSAINSNIKDHPIISRIQNMLYHSSLDISLCWLPSHCNILGNDQADRIARRSLDLHAISNMKCPKSDMLTILKKNIRAYWQQEYDTYHFYKCKDYVESWDSSFHENRLYEVVMARLRLNCIRGIHLIPRIENTYPLECECQEDRLSLRHIFFYCPNYTYQRLPIINMLQNDHKTLTLKNLFSDNSFYCKSIMTFLRSIKYLDKI